ncbi:MAG TPA: TonB-dependent receptor [Polyangiaceae bacterium LLY-WYZ-14_1]|nr:TonB-dependent receptor [Polyangiaceae bacterium LLY-WYZ-14_1]
MRDALLRGAVWLAVGFGWPAGWALAQEDPGEAADDAGGAAADAAPADADEGDADEGDAGEADAGEADAAEGAGDAPAASDRPGADDAADVSAGADAESPEADAGGGDSGDLSGAITTSEALTDEQLLNVDESMLIDPRPRKPRTGIYGRVIDAGTGEPIYAEVPVVVVENNERVFTTTDGFFTISIRPGTYTLRSFFAGYKNATLPDIQVRRGQTTELVVRMEPDVESDDLTIEITAERGTVARRLQERRQAAVVSDGFSAEEIKRSGDSDAGQAVRRIVGATLDREGFVFVRGLGGRYVNTLVNGSPFPSTDPENPSVRLTLFPTNILSGLSVYKTWNAEYPAAASAGTIDLETQSYPTRFEVNASVSIGLNTETTLGSVPTYEGSRADWLGIDAGAREIPQIIGSRRLPRAGMDGENLEAVRQFRHEPALLSRTAAPSFGVSASVGDTLLVGERFLGYYLAFGYDYEEQQFNDVVVRRVQADPNFSETCTTPETRDQCPNVARDEFRRNSSIQRVDWGALGTATLELVENQALKYTTVFTRRADAYTADQGGTNLQENQVIDQTRYQWIEEQVWWHQLRGDHEDLVEGISVNWTLNASLADRAEPDTTDIAYRGDRGEALFFSGRNPNEGQRLWSELDQTQLGGSLDAAIPVFDGTLKVGAFASGFDRAFQFRRFQIRPSFQGPVLPFTLQRENLFIFDAYAGGILTFNEASRPVDSYDATQRNYAAYVQYDTPLFTDRLRLVAGVRGEIFRQTIATDPAFASNPESALRETNNRTDVDVLPSVNVIAELTPTMQLRGGYTMTVARPLIRELAPVTFPDFQRNGIVTGEPDLQRTLMQNIDLRWEWFPSATEVLAASGFVKLFENPIEKIVVSDNNAFQFQNISTARNFGFEVEGRVDLERFADALKNQGLQFSANFTYVVSEIDLSIEERQDATSLQRPIAGQSPFVVNAGLSWNPDNEKTGIPLAFGLFYNVFGERIVEVGQLGLQDVFQQPFHSLNLTAQWDVSDMASLKLTMKNLLLEEQDFTQDDIVVFRFAPGLDASLTFGLRFD